MALVTVASAPLHSEGYRGSQHHTPARSGGGVPGALRIAAFGISLMCLNSGGSFATFEHPAVTNMLNKAIFLKAQTTGLATLKMPVCRGLNLTFDTRSICPANELDGLYFEAGSH